MNLADKLKKVMQGVKVVDKVDLTDMPEKAGPKSPTKAEKRENREYNQKLHELRDSIHNEEIIIADLQKKYDEDKVCQLASERKQAQLKADYLTLRCTIRNVHNDFSLSNDERQKNFHFQGIRPEPMDIVSFVFPQKTGPHREGVALVRDENHYYIAVDLYDQPEQEDNITTCMQENPDNTFEGIWPSPIILKKAGKYEERFMRDMEKKYADDIEKARIYLDNIQEKEEDEIAHLAKITEDNTEKLDEYAKIDAEIQERKAKIATYEQEIADLQKAQEPKPTKSDLSPEASNAKAPQCSVQSDSIALNPQQENQQSTPSAAIIDSFDRPTFPAPTPTEQRYPHLQYVRQKALMLDMSYPSIDYDYKPQLRFRLMGNIARFIDALGTHRALTYVLSEEYVTELRSRLKRSYCSMMPRDVVAEDEVSSGIIVYHNQGHEDTIFYEIANCTILTLRFVYIREGKLLFYESYSEQQIMGVPRIDNYICKEMREAGTDPQKLYAYIRNMVVSFLAMERDLDRTMNHFVLEGKGTKEERTYVKDELVNIENDEDVVIRDANWYTSISVDHLIPVNGYVSHRWCGKGKNKVLTEVWVRPHERAGYHREAGVNK